MKQPKTLESKIFHTFPEMGGGTFVKHFELDLPGLILPLRRCVPKVLNEEPAHTKSFVLFCNGVESGFRSTGAQSLAGVTLPGPVLAASKLEMPGPECHLEPGPGILNQGPVNPSDPKGALGAAGPAQDIRHQPPPGDAAEQGRDFCL